MNGEYKEKIGIQIGICYLKAFVSANSCLTKTLFPPGGNKQGDKRLGRDQKIGRKFAHKITVENKANSIQRIQNVKPMPNCLLGVPEKRVQLTNGS